MASTGKLGALVVIIAIVGTILGGTALGSEEVTRTTTDYSYVTDISGLFDYSDREIYVDYEPSKNLTGFSEYDQNYTTGIDYTPSSSMSSYPVQQEQTAYTGTVSATGSSTSRFILQCKLYPDQGTGNAAFYYTVNQPYVVALTDVFSSVLSNSYLDRMEISAGSYADFGPVIIRNSDILVSPNNSSWTYAQWYPTLYNITKYVFDSSTQIFQAISSTGAVAWETNIEEVRVVFGGTVNNSTITPTKSTLSRAFSYTYYEKVTPIYLDPTKGVAVSTEDTVTWKNGYSNSRVSLVFISPQDDEYNSYSSAFWIYNDGGLIENNLMDGAYFKVESSYDVMIVTYSKVKIHAQTLGIYSTVSTQEYTFNKWSGVKITLDCSDYTYTITPVGPVSGQSWPQFQDYVEYPSLSKSGVLPLDPIKITQIQFTSPDIDHNLRFIITDTRVFMDTYINVIYNETFNLDSYYDSQVMPYPKIDLKSFAMYGKSITINNRAFPVTDGHVTVTDIDGRERNVLLDNVSVIFRSATDTHVYINFKNDNVLVDLGTQASRSISFSGAWYLSADLYSGEEKTVTGYEFNPLQWAFEDNNVAILFYLGLLALCSIVAARYGGGLGWGDIILISCSGIVGFLLLV